MEYNKFEKIMIELQKFCEKIDNLSDTFECDFFLDLTGPLLDETVNLLGYYFEDEDNWIAYWMFDLNFGEAYRPGMVQEHGKDIPLRTINDLYRMLTA